MKDYELIEKEIGGKIHYYARFTDGQGIEQTAELDNEVYGVIKHSQKEISSQARKDRRYRLCSLDENIRDADIINEDEQTEELLKKVWQYSNELTEVQQRRLRQYIDEKKTFEQIAIIDDSTKQAVHKSLVKALDILRSKKYF